MKENSPHRRSRVSTGEQTTFGARFTAEPGAGLLDSDHAEVERAVAAHGFAVLAGHVDGSTGSRS